MPTSSCLFFLVVVVIDNFHVNLHHPILIVVVIVVVIVIVLITHLILWIRNRLEPHIIIRIHSPRRRLILNRRNRMRQLGHVPLKINPLALIAAQEADKHTRVQPAHGHLAHLLAVKGLELRGRVGGGIVLLHGVEPANEALGDAAPAFTGSAAAVVGSVPAGVGFGRAAAGFDLVAVPPCVRYGRG